MMPLRKLGAGSIRCVYIIIDLSGDSAGGNLAAGISLKLRDDKFKPMPKVQVLIYPLLQLLTVNTPSWQYNEHALVLSKAAALKFLCNYLFGDWTHFDVVYANNHTSADVKKRLIEHLPLDALPYDALRLDYKPQSIQEGDSVFWNKHRHFFIDSYLNPLMADSLRGLPPAVISSCQYDVLRDDSYFYAYRLRDAKVLVEHVALNACYHGWIASHRQIKQFDKYMDSLIQSIDKYI